MKIIKHGDEYNIHTCKKCKCEFGYLDKEIETNFIGDQKNQYISCPECGKVYIIKVIIIT